MADKEREYRGQEDVEPVVSWLNKHATDPAGRRIAALVHDLKSLSGRRPRFQPPTGQVAAWFEKHFKVDLRGLRWPKAWETVEAGQDCDPAVFERARRRLSRYAFRPWLLAPFIRGEMQNSLSIMWMSTSRRVKKQEAWAVALLVRLTEDGLLDKVRQCSCGKWFFPKKSYQEVCSRQCYLKGYWKTKEYRASHRKYMRGYYQIQKVRKARKK